MSWDQFMSRRESKKTAASEVAINSLIPVFAAVLHLIVTRNITKRRVDPLAMFLDKLPTLPLPSLVNWLKESRLADF
jgi:type IV secretory pathway TraG/TraD family ATPase VirD4